MATCSRSRAAILSSLPRPVTCSNIRAHGGRSEVAATEGRVRRATRLFPTRRNLSGKVLAQPARRVAPCGVFTRPSLVIMTSPCLVCGPRAPCDIPANSTRCGPQGCRRDATFWHRTRCPVYRPRVRPVTENDDLVARAQGEVEVLNDNQADGLKREGQRMHRFEAPLCQHDLQPTNRAL